MSLIHLSEMARGQCRGVVTDREWVSANTLHEIFPLFMLSEQLIGIN